jgi:hypothetical protein
MLSSTQTQLDPTTVRDVLRTYDTHHTGQQDETTTPTTTTSEQDAPLAPAPEASSSDPVLPANWPSDWHRTPPYRAASRNHRVSDRAAGVDNVEGAMVMFMFTGVFLQGVRMAPAPSHLGV